MKEIIRHKVEHNARRVLISIKWVIFAVLSGLIIGAVGTVFYFALTAVSRTARFLHF